MSLPVTHCKRVPGARQTTKLLFYHDRAPRRIAPRAPQFFICKSNFQGRVSYTSTHPCTLPTRVVLSHASRSPYPRARSPARATYSACDSPLRRARARNGPQQPWRALCARLRRRTWAAARIAAFLHEERLRQLQPAHMCAASEVGERVQAVHMSVMAREPRGTGVRAQCESHLSQ